MNHYGEPELLPNGLLRVWDYAASWAHLFKRVNGKWKHYAGMGNVKNLELLLNQSTLTQGRNEITKQDWQRNT
tara:strand:- start:1380 stop:1598 length:219 start_codon:yes stop_codon:yes gene_type:complete